MQIKSSKAKARYLQNTIRDLLITAFNFTKSDVRCAIMGENGVDIILSPTAYLKFPYAVEAKSRKVGFSAVYDAYTQALNNKNKTYGKRLVVINGEPLVVIKQNRKPPLAIVDLKYFINLHKK